MLNKELTTGNEWLLLENYLNVFWAKRKHLLPLELENMRAKRILRRGYFWLVVTRNLAFAKQNFINYSTKT